MFTMALIIKDNPMKKIILCVLALLPLAGHAGKITMSNPDEQELQGGKSKKESDISHSHISYNLICILSITLLSIFFNIIYTKQPSIISPFLIRH